MRPPELLRSAPERLRHLQNDTLDALALQALAALPGPFLPWTRFSLRPAAVLAVMNEIVINDRRVMVECGSGNSTIYAARLFKQLERGHITTLEHEDRFSEIIEANVAREGLSEFVTVVHAPLRDGWYDRDRIPRIDGIDLLVVDGPPSYDPPRYLAREPALAYFDPPRDATVILDDALRPGERQVLEHWQRSGREFVVERGGYAVSGPLTIEL